MDTCTPVPPGPSNVIATVGLSRYHDASGTGALVAGSTARPSYAASWYDGANRPIATAAYGNQGNDSTAFTRPDSPPDSSDDVLVSQTAYNTGGQVLDSIDAKGIITRTLYDNAGRATCTIANYVAASACGASGQLTPGESENVVTQMTYNADGQQLTLTAKNPATGDQVTTYVYGTTLDDSDLASGQLLRAEIYPDSGDGDDQVTYAFNRAGQSISMTDQNGSVHEYEYDLLGRRTVDKVTTVGSGVDNTVLRIDTGYEVRGTANLFTSYDNTAGTGTPLNQVQRTFNDFGQLEKSEQEHVGAVDGSTLSVDYAFVDGTGNTARPTSVTYPDGRVLTLEYTAGDDDELSRVKTLDWNGTDASTYTYLGAGRIVKENYPVPSVALDYIGSGNSYSGFDRFGRVVDQKWTGGSGDVDQFTYGYDRNSNRTYRGNVVAESETTPVHLDELYGYDDINRLTAAHRGQLNNGDRITDHALSQTWELDATGNWKQFSSYDQATASDVLVQQRTHNEVNEITGISETVGDQWVTPAHDRNGNMTTIPQPAAPTSSYTLIWDAWNRLVEVKDGATTVGQYSYDGLGRRVRKYVPGSPDSYQHFYFNAVWQLLETREASTAPVPATAQYQYVWSLRYIDAPILRDDRAADPDEVLYYLGDANFNVTTLIDIAGTSVERYVYDPYGTVTIYNTDWTATRSTSQYNNSIRYAGSWDDGETDVYYYRARYYDSGTGRFTSRDPAGYVEAPNLYLYVGGGPVNNVDPTGLWRKVNDNTYESDGCHESLMDLAELVSGDPRDWVCIWPVDDWQWQDYPVASDGAKANVENLRATNGANTREAKLMPILPRGDNYLRAVMVMLNNDRRGGRSSHWRDGPTAARMIRRWSGEGATPIRWMVVGAHCAGGVAVGDMLGNRLFQATHLAGVATEPNNATNTFASALRKIGPPRCWFTRSAQIWGVGCNTNTWAADWANRVLRVGATANGTTAFVWGTWVPGARGMPATSTVFFTAALPPAGGRAVPIGGAGNVAANLPAFFALAGGWMTAAGTQ